MDVGGFCTPTRGMRALRVRGRSSNLPPTLIANKEILGRQCVRKRGYNVGNFGDGIICHMPGVVPTPLFKFLRKESAARLRLREFPFLLVSSSAESFPGSSPLCFSPSITHMWGTALNNRHQTRIFNEAFPLFCIIDVQAACGH